jgi:hypothetical protein
MTNKIAEKAKQYHKWRINHSRNEFYLFSNKFTTVD